MSKTEQCWIWFWYNDLVRLLFVILGGNLLLTLPLLLILSISGEEIRTIVLIQYIMVIQLAMFFNDYSNLRKIGMDEYRNKLINPVEKK